MNIRPYPHLRRTPQTTNGSPSSPTTAVATTTESARSISWDSAHWVVGTLPSSSATASPSDAGQGNGSLLSNTGAFAGVLVGVAGSCLILIGFLVYQGKFHKPKPQPLSRHSGLFSKLGSSTMTGPIKLPPSPSPDHISSRPFQPLSIAASSVRQLQRRTINPAIANFSGNSARSGFTLPDTPGDRNEFELSQRTEQTSLSRSPFDIPVSGSSSIMTYQGREARASAGAVSFATSRGTSVHRPLPFPPHSPPPYSPNHASLRPSSSQNNSSVPSPLSSVFPSDEKYRSPFTGDGVSRVNQPPPIDGEYPMRYHMPSTNDDIGAEGPQAPFRGSNGAALSNTLAVPTAPALQDSTMSSTSTAIEYGDDPPSSWRSPMSQLPPRPMSVNSDPFNNRDFELPNWVHLDPYSHRGPVARGTVSIYSVAQRSVAASSKILPSDTSLRTLTPEPSEDDHDATLDVGVLAGFRLTTTGQGADALGTVDGESVEGDGPESHALQVSGGAERRGWGTEDTRQGGLQRTTSSGSIATIQFLHTGHFSPGAVSPAPASSNSPTTSNGVPLSAGFETRGLGRSFIHSLRSKLRWSSTTVTDNSPLPTAPQEAPEGMPAWVHEDPYERRRTSTGAASSKLLPSEVGHGDASSIRSVRPEVGWIESRRGSDDIQNPSIPIPGPVDGHRALGVPPSVIGEEPVLSAATEAQESSQPQSQPRPLPPIPAPPPS